MAETKLSSIEIPEGESPKQIIINLLERKTLNLLQSKALAARYEELLAAGEKPAEALAATFKEFDAGRLVVDPEAAERERTPRLDEAPRDLNDKSKLL